MKNKVPPLSPFFIYKWRYTFFDLSIINRVTGVALSVGLLLLIYFLWCILRPGFIRTSSYVFLSSCRHVRLTKAVRRFRADIERL
jgi:hypothetical protein